MNVQIWETKGFDSQKAVRFFKERRVSAQRIDLWRFGISKRELESVIRQVGLEALIDRDSATFAESPVRFSTTQSLLFQALLDNPRMIRAPIVRCGKLATVGYKPDVWSGWPL